MNREQENYAVSRIKEIAAQKKDETYKHIDKQYLKDKDKHEALRKGEAKLLPLDNGYKDDISSWYEFPAQKKFDDEYNKKKSAQDKRIVEIKTESTRIIDEIRLGNAEEAMKLIKAFMKF